MDVSSVLDHYSKLKKKVIFLQIGSNDGLESDPLRKFITRDRWYGILVEPLPDTFKKLLANYNSYEFKSDLVFENLHLNLNDYKNCVRELRSHNYMLYEQNLDTIAIQREWHSKIIKN